MTRKLSIVQEKSAGSQIFSEVPAMRSRPYVILSAAASVDGKIAAGDGSSRLSSDLDLQRLHELRANVDALMVGINTVIVDNPLLTNRSGVGSSPIRVIVDSKLSIPASSRVLRDLSKYQTLIACTHRAPLQRIALLERTGARVLVVGEEQKRRGNVPAGRVELVHLLRILKDQEGIERLLLEGGSELNWSMVSEGLVDELRLTIAPVLIGGTFSKSLIGGEGFPSVQESVALRLLDFGVVKGTGEVLLRYGLKPLHKKKSKKATVRSVI